MCIRDRQYSARLHREAMEIHNHDSIDNKGNTCPSSNEYCKVALKRFIALSARTSSHALGQNIDKSVESSG